MNKDELKQYLLGMELEPEFQAMLFDLIEKAPQADQNLLSTVADILELQADFYEKSAELLDEEADEYEVLADDMNAADEEERAERMEALQENQEQLLKDLNAKIEETKSSQTTQGVDAMRQELQQHAASSATTPTPTAVETPAPVVSSLQTPTV